MTELDHRRTLVSSGSPTPARAMWLVVVAAIALTLGATEVLLGAIKQRSGEVSDVLYVVVFAGVSIFSLLFSFFASEFVRDVRHDREGRRSTTPP